MQLLHTLLEHLCYESVRGQTDIEVSDICCHSKKAGKNSLFVCISGYHSNGHEYIGEALLNGARVFVVEKQYVIESGSNAVILTEHQKIDITKLTEEYHACIVAVRNARKALSRLSAVFFGFPAQKLKIIGITGTNGKTTTAFLTAGILREAGYKTGLIGTIYCDDGKEQKELKNTTPESCDIHRMLAKMIENECTCCVMEVSSQGIAMYRTRDIFFEIGIFLNIEPDHIGKGEHSSFSEYLYCKSKLMRQCRIGIVNRDDVNTDKILVGHTCLVETFSMKHDADVTASQEDYCMEHGMLKSTFTVNKGNYKFRVQMQLPGQFNIYNALAAICAAGHFQVSSEQMKQALKKQEVPGRCQNMTAGKSFAFLIDYAHNEMSLRNVLETLKAFHPNRLIVIFGCGGGRSELRRYHMGETAGRLADFIIVTSDNPRWEEPEEIMSQIEQGILLTKGQYCYVKITDRKEAVRCAVNMAQENDILVLAGKGHESCQEIKGICRPMDDRQLIQEVLHDAVCEYHS